MNARTWIVLADEATAKVYEPQAGRRDWKLIAEVAERVGYGSASTFSTAFSRHVGQPPSRYARER